MRDVTADDVAQHLSLPVELGPWLDGLEQIGRPPGGLHLPGGDAAREQLARLGVAEPDLGAILEAIPRPEADPDLWWLLERAYECVRRGIGQWGAFERWPSLPAHLGVLGRCFWVYVFLAAADDLRTWHAGVGIPEEVSRDTLADLGRHVARFRRRNGITGFDSQFWLSLHFRGELYELGRLQFNAYHLRTGPGGPLFWYDEERARALGPGFRPGDATLGIHVPAGAPLAPEACDASFQMAGPFFRRHFPKHDARIATCTSWLLDDQLADYLSPDSNIVRFQKRFELVPGARQDDDEVFRFVLDRVPTSLDDFEPRTQLERVLVEHVRRGGHWHMRTGWLAL